MVELLLQLLLLLLPLLLLLWMKQTSEISRHIAVTTSEHADRYVLFQLYSGLGQHVLGYVGVQSRSRHSFLKSAHQVLTGSGTGIGVHRGIVQRGESCDESHVRLDERVAQRSVDERECRGIFHEQFVDAASATTERLSTTSRRKIAYRNGYARIQLLESTVACETTST